MSPNPRGLNNMSANNLILSNFPEQGSELVSEAKEKNRHRGMNKQRQVQN